MVPFFKGFKLKRIATNNVMKWVFLSVQFMEFDVNNSGDIGKTFYLEIAIELYLSNYFKYVIVNYGFEIQYI